MLAVLHLFQPLIIPLIIVLTVWATLVTVFKKDRAVGFALYVSLLIVVDSYLNTGIYIPGLQYGSIRYSEVILLCLIITAPERVASSGVHKLLWSLIALYFILFFYSALRGLTVTDGLNNFRGVIVPQIEAFWIGRRGFRNREDYQRFFSYLILLLIIIGLFTVWDVFFDTILLHSDRIFTAEYYMNRKNGRFGSFFLNPIDLGNFTVLLLPAVLLTMGAQRTILRKAIYWAGIMLFAFAFIKTQARGAMIGCAASLVVFLLLPHRNYPVYRRGLSILLMIGLLGLFMPGFYETATRRFDSIEKETSLEEANRVSTWEHVVTEVIPSYPVFGIGLGEAQFIRIMRDTGYEDKFGRTFDNPHSSYLEIAVAAGCVALLIFLTVNFLIIVTNVSFLRSNVESEHSLLLLGLTSGLVGFLVATASGQDMFRASVAPVYWLITGLCLSLTSNRSARRQVPDDLKVGHPAPTFAQSVGGRAISRF